MRCSSMLNVFDPDDGTKIIIRHLFTFYLSTSAQHFLLFTFRFIDLDQGSNSLAINLRGAV
jgi:hypothetical protein